jgi:carotenoid 1,2-hydratase
VTLIAFIGSVFSPRYFRARRRDPAADPLAHCGINIGVYGRHDQRWVFTEVGRAAVRRSTDRLALSATALQWTSAGLELRFDERAVPFGRRVRGTVRLDAGPRFSSAFAVDPHGHHHWWPIAPVARVEVELEEPALRFAGSGYLDSNFGDAPLERAFSKWTWSRASNETSTVVLYDVTTREGDMRPLGLRFERDGTMVPLSEPTEVQALPPTTVWRMPRLMRAARGGSPRVLRTFEDTPFYSRSLVELPLGGASMRAVHESLDLGRFAHPLVQRLLPFRIRRGGST